MKTAKMMLEGRETVPWTASPALKAAEALRYMAEKDIGALAVIDGSRLVGILSERDYVRKLVLGGLDPATTVVADIMTRKVVCVRPERRVEECMALMIDKKIRHLPVLEGERFLGMLSIRDVVRATIAEQKFVIEQLEHYITG